MKEKIRAAHAAERDIFGEEWERNTCSMKQAEAYFTRRFGRGRTCFYHVLHPRLVRVALEPGNRAGRMRGWVLFSSQVVSACDALEERARETVAAGKVAV